ncbi:hypothetical protein Q8F55_000032 [Vanrija albida]|uniref:F-box domain-containing protein n=1 Tax=Vanrija albida TaxID=181172 RepID=A0ABR3QC53_9TREE
MDSTAFPHIFEQIILNCSVKALVAIRATSKRWQRIVDTLLFHHCVIDRFPLGERSQSRLAIRKRLTTWRRDGDKRGVLGRRVIPDAEPTSKWVAVRPEDKTTPNWTLDFVVSPTSGLDSDMTLPLAPWKARIIDLEGRGRRINDFIDATDPTALEPDRPVPVEITSLQPHREFPLVLRRFGKTVAQTWPGPVETVVDFAPEGAEGWSMASVPGRSGQSCKYIRHIEWGRVSRPDRLQYIDGQGGGVHNATLVLAPHCTPPSPYHAMKLISGFARHFADGIISGTITFTLVGAENWLPDFDADEIRAHMISGTRRADRHLMLAYLRRSNHTLYDLSKTTIVEAYQYVRVITLAEWWDELGELKDVVGVWPEDRRNEWDREEWSWE